MQRIPIFSYPVLTLMSTKGMLGKSKDYFGGGVAGEGFRGYTQNTDT